MTAKELSDHFVKAKQAYGQHPFFSILIPVISTTKIILSRDVDSAGIKWKDGSPLMLVNPKFCDKYMESKEDVLFLLSHEICHYVLGHLNSAMETFNSEYGHDVTNIALDIIIDQMLYKELGEKHSEIKLIDYYKKYLCPIRLLVPPSAISEEDFQLETCKEVFRQIQSGKRLTPYRLVQHILSHGEFAYKPIIRTMGADAHVRWRYSAEIQRALRPLTGLLMKNFYGIQPRTLHRSELPFRQRFMRVIEDLVSDNEAEIREHQRSEGMLPFAGRRDFVSLAVRKPQVIYHSNPSWQEGKGVKVYFDVSGSMNQHLALVLSLLDMITDHISYPLYAFSVGVQPVTKQQLARRKITSLGGTDFDSLAKHIISNRHEKVLLLTDGEAEISEHLARQLRRNHKIITVLSSMGSEDSAERFSERVMRMG